MRFRGVTRKLPHFRVIVNGFRAPLCRSGPPHLHRGFRASAPSLPQGPTWPYAVGTSSVPSSDPWGCTLVHLASPAHLGPALLTFGPSVRRCRVLDQEEGLCPWRPCPPMVVRSSECARVTCWLQCLYRRPPGPGDGGEGARAIPDMTSWCPWPHYRPTGPSRSVSPSELWGSTLRPSWTECGGSLGLTKEEPVGRPGVIALPIPYLLGFCCH